MNVDDFLIPVELPLNYLAAIKNYIRGIKNISNKFYYNLNYNFITILLQLLFAFDNRSPSIYKEHI